LGPTALEDRTVLTPAATIALISHATEGVSDGLVRVTLSETSSEWVTVSLSLGGTAGMSDYMTNPPAVMIEPGHTTADVVIDVTGSPMDDSTSEPTETVILTVNVGTGYTVGTPGSVTVNLFDNDAQYVSVVDTSDAEENGDVGVFELTRIGDLSSALTVSYSVGGSATSDGDFVALAGQVTFLAGSATANVNVTPIDDVKYDPGETVSLTATSGTGYTVGSPSSDSLTITDDELTPVYWVGGSGASWSSTSSWSGGVVPTSTTAVYFNSTHSNYGVTLPTTATHVGRVAL